MANQSLAKKQKIVFQGCIHAGNLTSCFYVTTSFFLQMLRNKGNFLRETHIGNMFWLARRTPRRASMALRGSKALSDQRNERRGKDASEIPDRRKETLSSWGFCFGGIYGQTFT